MLETKKEPATENHWPTQKGFDGMSIPQEDSKRQVDWALTYASIGWPVFPLVPNGKKPLTKNGFKDATTDANKIREWWSQNPEANIGLPTGIKFDVLDFDLSLSGEKGRPLPWIWDEWKSHLGDALVVRTRNGYHVYYAPTGCGNRAQIGPLTGDTDSKGKEKRACDWRGAGGYVVAPPSTFSDGSGCYEWVVGMKATSGAIPEAPEDIRGWLSPKRAQKSAHALPIENQATNAPSDQQAMAYVESVIEGISNDMSSAAEGERNQTLFRLSARAFELLNGSLSRVSGADRILMALYNAAKSTGLDDAEINQTMDSAKRKVGATSVEPEWKQSSSPEQARVSIEHNAQWMSRLQRFPEKKDGTPGAIMPMQSNVSIILENDPRWKGKLVFNEFSHNVEKTSRTPCDGGSRKWSATWSDLDDAELSDWLSVSYGLHMKDISMQRRAVLVTAHKREYHPVRKYLSSLKWDGVERLSRVPGDLFGCEQPEYAGKVFRWWMLSAVYRVMDPGCKADYAIILEGAQGIGKSTILAILGGEWFMDSPIDMNSKDAYSQTIGTWIVEIPELSGFSKTDDTRAKSFFSERKPRVRLPFRRDAEEIPRECVFAGTTNENDYLKDSTGNRRYWPIKCGANGKIMLNELSNVRDQLWAEATEMWRRKERYYPTTAEDNEMLTGQQAQRTLDDVWSYPVYNWLKTHTHLDCFVSADVFAEALNKPIGTASSADGRRLAAILKRYGYESFRKTIKGQKVTMYRLAKGAMLPEVVQDTAEDEPKDDGADDMQFDDIPWPKY